MITRAFSRVCLTLGLFCVSVPGADGPLHVWDVGEANWQGDRLPLKAGNLEARANKPPAFEDGDLNLNADTWVIVPGISGKQLPSTNLTVDAVVAIDRGQQWGSILSFSQDNGNYEKGWLLGYNQTRLAFCVSVGPRLVYLYSRTPFEPGEWVHVAGTYDGTTIRLYVNGAEEASSTAATGPIAYPPNAFYVLGAYKDNDEQFPMDGKIRMARLWNRTLGGKDIAKLARATGAQVTTTLPFVVKPYLQFKTPDSAEVVWESSAPGPGTVRFGLTKKMDRLAPSKQAGTSHAVTIDGLLPNSVYHYRIEMKTADGESRSKTFTFNTALNYALRPVGEASGNKAAEQLAGRIIEKTGAAKGYALLLGAGEGTLAYELARQSDLIVVAVDTDRARVDRVRQKLYKKGVYGSRVTVMHADAYDALPMTGCFANLGVVQSGVATTMESLKHWLRPGGMACFLDTKGSWKQFKRLPIKGVGEWSHMYGDPGNRASTGETLGGATSTSDLALQWLGRPGGDFGIDRQPRMPAPLSVDGRLFHQGMDRLIALDSYNGTVLWNMEIPDLRRVNMPRDAANWCLDKKNLYLAVKDRAWVIDARTGKRRVALSLPPDRNEGYEWGYIGRAEGRLIGSSVKAGSVFQRYWGKEAWFDANRATDATKQICGDDLFAYDAGTGKIAWRYENGLILHSTIAMGDGRIFFVESRNPEVKQEKTGRIGSPNLWKDQFLVSLDAKTGKTVWEQPIDTEDGLIVFYLQYSPYGLMLTISNKQYFFYNFDPLTGKQKWRQTAAWAANHHSGHIQHPVIVGDKLYLQPNGFDLKTGNQVTSRVGTREGCTTYVGSTGALIYRGRGRRISMWDPETNQISAWNNLRPSCWLNIIPAGGLLQIPEGGAGCSCGRWMETSVVFAPKELVEKKEEKK